MRAALALLGALLVAVAMVDAIKTTLAAGAGGGPLTERLSAWVWRALRALSTKGLSRLLPYSGPLVLVTTVLTWVTLLWAGWTLIFSSAHSAVVDAQTGAPADIAARIYFTGFVIFTLGVGDFVPAGALWQVVTALATFIGLALITLSITYLVSVVAAAVNRRTLARSINLSGETGVDIVLLHWNGSALSINLASMTQSLNTQILAVTQQHLAYPVLHHFHAATPGSAAPRALAALDDAVTILSAGLREDIRPDVDVLTRLQRTLEHYATTVGGAAADDARLPPLPNLSPLRQVGVPTVSDGAFAAASAAHAPRRAAIHELVEADASRWPTR